MSPKGRNHLVFLEDILEAIAKIGRYTQGLSLETFRENDMAVDAVIRNFEVIGEAVRHIPDGVKERYPDVEWKEAAGFRNILIHETQNSQQSAVVSQESKHDEQDSKT